MPPDTRSTARVLFRLFVTACVILTSTGCGVGDGERSDPGSSLEAWFSDDDYIIEEKGCVDFWTAVHFGAGYLLGGRQGEDGFQESVALLVGYELVEPHFWPHFGENGLNQGCDLVFGVLGWLAWYYTGGD